MIELKSEIHQRLQNHLVDSFNNNASFAIVVQHLNGSEFALHLLKTVDEYLQDRPYDEVCFINLNKTPLIYPSNAAIFGMQDIGTYEWTLIATDIPTWQASLKSPSKNKFLFLYDVFLMKQVPKELIKQINDSGYKIFTRTSEHKKLLDKLGFTNVLSKYVEEIDVEMIISVVSSGENNVNN